MARIAALRARSRWWLLLAVAIVAATVAGPAVAWSYWSGVDEPLRGVGAAGAATVNSGSVPTASTDETGTTLAWGASTLSNGLPVDGYVIRRYSHGTGIERPVGPGCAGTIRERTCTETGVPAGSWHYTVTPTFASGWQGAEGPRSGSVSVGSATLGLDQTLFGAPLPATTTGSVGGFAPSESISFNLDGTPISAAPTSVDLDGTATITDLRIPSVADGPHTVQVVGAASGTTASSAILVDTTPPVLAAAVTPPPNAAGWNRTPVVVAGSVDDGDGSGVAFVKFTTDGSDPRTSPTAEYSDGTPLSRSTTTTAKYYGVDLAGNETPVQTLPIKIDMTPPSFRAEAVDVTGGAVVTAGTPEAPGVAHYRGSATGSFRLRFTVPPDDGSPAASVGSSVLADTTTGFTLTPTVTTTPAGGPYVTTPVSWVAGTTSTPLATFTVSDVAGNTTVASGSLFNDSTAPSGGSITYTSGSSTTTRVVFAPGQDDQSGLAPGSGRLQRATAPLAGGSCGSFGAFTTIAADPQSPHTDPSAADGCYQYRYLVSDAVGNQATYASPDVLRRDTTAPTHVLSLTGPVGAFLGGSTLYYKGNAPGSFRFVDALGDTGTGPASVTYPAIGSSGWTHANQTVTTPSGGPYGSSSFSWTANPSVPPPYAIEGKDLLGTTASTTVSFVSDTAPPAGGSVGYANGNLTGSSIPVTLADGTDGLSGIDPAARLLRRDQAPLNATTGACGSFPGTFATLVSLVGGADTSVRGGTCYRYRYLVSDNVGNQATYTGASIAKLLDTAPPTIDRAVAVKADGTTPGTIRQGGSYYVYAQVADDAGVATVTTNVNAFDTGVTAGSLTTTGGPWTVGGTTYNYRSTALTANTGLTTGTTPGYTITATDTAANTAGPTGYTARIEAYADVVATTPGLVSYWRFGDGALAADEFTDSSGTLLSAHTGAVGATWTADPTQTRTASITAAGRLRRQSGSGGALYTASSSPTSANYLVEADVYAASLPATDTVGVVGRQSVSGTVQTYYSARYLVDTKRWELAKVVNGSLTPIGTGTGTGYYSQSLAAGTSYRLTLRMSGSTISLLVDGVARVTATDAAITAAGRGGVRMGSSTTNAVASETAGLHLDDFRISSLTTTAADSRSTNPGTYANGPRLNQPGALAGDPDRAAHLDGINDYISVPDASTLRLGDGPLTLEAWIKRSDASTGRLDIFQKGSSAVQFGLNKNAPFLAKDDVATLTSSTTTITNTSWHHLLVTKSGSAAKLYVDGVDRTGTVTNQTLINTSAALLFGSKNGTSEFLGATIDEFAIYSAVLSGATALDHYRLGTGTG